ncbi:ATP-binding protein [Cyanothece sp. BG0011]|uniref:ATP-binding protein n=1 Tax=Cyanothece sp. BG0011 TaxID=2082950 RepID=UPI000D1F118A|nr:ATP-binding protein [Cyanothece sp. BG0011]
MSVTTINYQEQKIKALQEFFKKKKINNAIILMDGIENNLHPDWQYNIVHELASWGDNQYLLATHSFYLCEALTPGHVKIIK